MRLTLCLLVCVLLVGSSFTDAKRLLKKHTTKQFDLAKFTALAAKNNPVGALVEYVTSKGAGVTGDTELIAKLQALEEAEAGAEALQSYICESITSTDAKFLELCPKPEASRAACKLTVVDRDGKKHQLDMNGLDDMDDVKEALKLKGVVVPPGIALYKDGVAIYDNELLGTLNLGPSDELTLDVPASKNGGALLEEGAQAARTQVRGGGEGCAYCECTMKNQMSGHHEYSSRKFSRKSSCRADCKESCQRKANKYGFAYRSWDCKEKDGDEC